MKEIEAKEYLTKLYAKRMEKANPKIRFVVHTTIKRRDTNGNCYSYTAVINTQTGRRLVVDYGASSGEGNIKSLLMRECGLQHGQIVCQERILSAKEYTRQKHSQIPLVFAHDLTREMILELDCAKGIIK